MCLQGFPATRLASARKPLQPGRRTGSAGTVPVGPMCPQQQLQQTGLAPKLAQLSPCLCLQAGEIPRACLGCACACPD